MGLVENVKVGSKIFTCSDIEVFPVFLTMLEFFLVTPLLSLPNLPL